MSAGVLPHVIALLTDHSAESHHVATAAAATLMALTVENSVKSEAVRLGAVKALAPLLEQAVALENAGELSHTNATCAANVTKCIANLAEDPKGRKQLTASVLENLRPLALSSEPLVNKHAVVAVNKVEYRP